MTKLRLVLLATTALTAMQFVSPLSHAQTAALVVAQAQNEVGPDGKPKPKEPPKAAPTHPAPPKPAAPPPHPAAPAPKPAAPPAAAPPPHPAPPPPHQPPAAAPPRRPAPPAEPVQPKPAASGAAPAAQPAQKGVPAPATPQSPGGAATPPPRRPGPPGNNNQAPNPAPAAPNAAPVAPAAPNAAPAAPNAAPPQGGGPRGQTTPPPGAAPLVRHAPPTVTAPLPVVPPRAQALTPIAPGAAPQGPQRMEGFRSERKEVQEGGRTVFTEPGRVIIRDPSGQSFVRHDEMDRFRFGARDIQTRQVGAETQTVVIRPDGSQIITVSGRDGELLRRIRRDQQGREIIIIDNTYRDPGAVGGYYVDLPPPVIGIPYDRYIVDAGDASPDLIYDTMEAPPVDRIDRRYSLDEIRYSPSVRMLMPSIDLNTINFETGSWEIPPDQAAKLQSIADGLNRAITRNPREVFLIEGHTDAVGNSVDNLSLSDRRAESAAELLTQQFGVPAENLTSQGYGSQYLKEQTDGPSRINRRVTVRRITPLLNGGVASFAAPR